MNYGRANAWLLCCLSAFCLMTGASLWETAVFVPIWSSGRPGGLTVLRGDVGIDASYLWVTVHSVFEITLLFALIFNWRIKPRRNVLLAFGVVYVAVRLWTIFYFAPSFLAFQKLADSPEIAYPLLEGAGRWKSLNLIRTGLVTCLNFALLAYVIKTLSPRKTVETPASQT
jgi:hypothetical protein